MKDSIKLEKKTKEDKAEKKPGVSLARYTEETRQESPSPWPSRSSRIDKKTKLESSARQIIMTKTTKTTKMMTT